MKLWQDYSNATTEQEITALENKMVQQYTPLISRVWSRNFRSRDFEESQAQGMISLWEAIKKWKADAKIGQQTQGQLLNFLGRAIFNGMANYWRNANNGKSNIASTNVESFEIIPSLNSTNVSEQTRREEAEQEVRDLIERSGVNPKVYELLLEKYGNNEEWETLYEEAGYSSPGSMREAIRQTLTRMRAVA